MLLKLFAVLFALIFSFRIFSANDLCVGKTGCELKKCEIDVKIIYAEQEKNEREINDLNRALDSVQKNCSIESLKKEHEDKIHDKKKEVIERSKDLNEALASGKKDEIGKSTKRLNEAKAELLKLQSVPY